MNSQSRQPDDSADSLGSLSAWFAGPKAENAAWFEDVIARICADYYAWRRNYFPEDGVVVDSAARREGEPFRDAFEDRLLELLGRLKADFPFYSPRYAAHMIAEQSLPSLAGYFAALLYNPNNVSTDAAPVTVRLEHEAARMIARMLGYGAGCWGHLTSGGTVANLEAMWMARTVRYLPLVIDDMRAAVGIAAISWSCEPGRLISHVSPQRALEALAQTFADAGPSESARLIRAYLDSPSNIVMRGAAAVVARTGSEPVLILPETHHYCFEKIVDVLGLGRHALMPIPVDGDFRMLPDELESALDQIEAQGRHPLAVVAVVGSTEEGAVDPVDAIVAVRARREAAGQSTFWLHADAAYGGYLRTVVIPTRLGLGPPATEARVGGRVRTLDLRLPVGDTCAALEQLGQSDSITVDPHKLGYIPYPAGCICFRSDLVKPLARQDAPYLTDAPADVEAERQSQSIGVYILEGSKPGAAAASVWLSHSLIPLDNTGHGILVRETIRNACALHALLEKFPDLSDHPLPVRAVPLCHPGSNIVCYAFRSASRALPLERVNALNRRIYDRFTRSGESRIYDQSFFVSRTTLSPNRYAVRSVGPFLTLLGVTEIEYRSHGVFLLRSVLMNPWHAHAKTRGRDYLAELVVELYRIAAEECSASMSVK